MRNYSIFPLQQRNKGHELDFYIDKLRSKAPIYFYLVGSPKSVQHWKQRIGKEISPLICVGNGDLGDFVSLDDKTMRERLLNEQARIIATDSGFDEYKAIEKFWLNRGAKLNQTFFQAEVFWPIWQVYQKGYLCLDRIEIFLTDKCTLSCEKCLHFIPYLHGHHDTSLEQLKRDADILFSRVDCVRKLKLLGGEVFLYPHLGEYLDYLGKHYIDQIEEIRLGTNGTMFPPKDILETCRRYDAIIDVSDYSTAVKRSYNLTKCVEYFRENGLTVDIKRTGEKWLDMGFPAVKPSKRADGDNQRHFFHCAMFCRQFAKGKLYFCCTNYAAVRGGFFPDDENDYFDFYAEPFDKKELLEFELGFNPKGYMTFCEVCFGGSEQNNNHVVPVAKQMFLNKKISEGIV